VLGIPDQIHASLFDLDGVRTKTAQVDAAAWKEMFDGYLHTRAIPVGQPFVPFDPVDKTYVDGMPRAGGVRSFPASRGLELPDGSPDYPPDADSVPGLGNRTNVIQLEVMRRECAPGRAGAPRADGTDLVVSELTELADQS
jgi:beta-phosphoglucomutase-like phosphatase (HAD superfamily)